MVVHSLVDRYRKARRDPSLAVLDGLHPLKHALRFGAEVVEAAGPDLERLRRLAEEFAPDVAEALLRLVAPVSEDTFRRLSPVAPDTGVVAIARRPAVAAEAALRDRSGLVALLENPRNPFNIGAAVRVAAAAGAAGLVTTGAQDPWHPAAIVSGVGLQFALPVCRAESLAGLRLPPGRPLVVVDSRGEPMPWASVPTDAVIAFGTERRGASPELLAMASRRLAIPMTPGVSSLNLATAAAVALYALKAGGELVGGA